MARISRRAFIAGGAVAAGVAVVATRPGDRSGPREPYFMQVQRALSRAGIAVPTLVIDRQRLNANIDTLASDLPEDMGFRIVAKSLPSTNLIQHIRKRTGTGLLMTFNLPMLISLSKIMPKADQLLGKPLPVQAAKSFFETVLDPRALANVQWLIDTPERLQQYRALAGAREIDIRVNLEIDIGFHRGGFETDNALKEALAVIRDDPRLNFSGFMGYEPHVAKTPDILGWRGRALDAAWRSYLDAIALAEGVLGKSAVDDAVRNGGGSPTYRFYKSTEIANELSIGSALVKPTDFDTDMLSPYVPASFIAAPVLKTYDQTRLPLSGMEFVSDIKRLVNPNSAKTVFIYGGNWLAKPVDPPGLEHNSIWGHSSNQEMLNGGAALELTPDEFVFLRPSQSEAVFLQFGDIAVYDNGEIAERWPVFPASA